MKKFLRLILILVLTLALFTVNALACSPLDTSVDHHENVIQTNVVKPSCLGGGYYTLECTVCGWIGTYSTGNAVPHDFGPWTAVPGEEPTCTKAGAKQAYCNTCYKWYKTPAPATGHSFGEWFTTTQPTCMEEGIQTRECTLCGKTERRGISKTDHSWDAGTVIVQPTTEHEGVTEWVCTVCSMIRTTPIPKSINPFVDVAGGTYYYDPVLWAVANGITSGVDATHFDPNGICTRAHAVTFLWRAAGQPEPKTMQMPFKDVKAGSYYEKAVRWAVEEGITNGTSTTTFSPDAHCTRAQIVTFLWRSKGSPKVVGVVDPFTDVASAYYTNAVFWAVKGGITNGTSATTFSPDANCTRGQIVTFLYRAKLL